MAGVRRSGGRYLSSNGEAPLEECALHTIVGWAECRAIESEAFAAGEAVAATGEPEALGDEFDEMALAAHAVAEVAVVVSAAATLLDEAHDVGGPVWEVGLQPVAKQRCDLMR